MNWEAIGAVGEVIGAVVVTLAPRRPTASLELAATVSSILCLSACVTTPHQGVHVGELSDEQLIAELDAAARGVGVAINRVEYLIATRPDPAYVLSSSSTNFFGSFNATTSAYAMPAGYRTHGSYSGMSHTQYYYTDVNALARSMNGIGQAIVKSQRVAYEKRGLEVLAEIRSRTAIRRAEMENLLREFGKGERARSAVSITQIAVWPSRQLVANRGGVVVSPSL